MQTLLRNSVAAIGAALLLSLAGGASLAQTVTAVTPSPKQRFVDDNGNACSGCLLFTYAAGSTTKQNTFTDNTGVTANPDPIVLDSRGEAAIWLTYGAVYKFVLAPATDTDPPTNAIWTVDNVQGMGSMAAQNADSVTVTGGSVTGVTLGSSTLSTGSTLTDVINQGYAVSTADTSWTSSTTLTVVTGLSINLTAGKTYSCRGHLTVTASGASGGIKTALVASNGLTATSVSFAAANFNGTTTNARSTTASLGTAIGGATAAATDVEVVGAIVVSAAGTINLEAAQNASDATTLTVGKNSVFRCVRVN